MSLGDALVLASVIFAPIYLYKITRDRWNWKRGVRRFLQGFFLVITLGCLLWWSIEKINDISRQTEYADLRLGMTMAEARYSKGVPDNVYKEETEGEWKNSYQVIRVSDLKGQRAEDFKHWSYSLNG